MSNLRKLAYRIRKTRYALFLGAGASVESGGYTAQDIAWEILRKLYGTRSKEELQKLFQTEYNTSISFENVLQTLGTSSVDRRDMIINFFEKMVPSEGYHHLAVLLKAGYFYPIVLTTNVEHMLEDALSADNSTEENITVRVLLAEELTSPSIEPCKGEVIIVKLNGDISKPDSLRMTTLDTISLSENCEKLLINICEQHGLFVVGYRAKDIGIRNALQKSKPSAKGLFWVSKDTLNETEDREVLLLLDRHNSRNNIISGITFDGLFKELGIDLIKAKNREKHRHELDNAWILMDRSRSFGSERREILQRLNDLSNQLLREMDLEEVLALREFVRYELDKSGETYRLQQGVKFLKTALEGYAKYVGEDELTIIEYALLGELLNLFLTGNHVPGGRLEYLNQLITRAEVLLNKIHQKEIIPMARALIVLTEALKEKAMVTMGREEQIQICTKVRAYGEKAISLLKDVGTPESKYLLGTAYRHTGVAYELDGDIATNEEERRRCYERWRQYSSIAIDILREVGEDAVRGYALMNLASSHTRLCEFEVSDWKKRQLLEVGKAQLEESIRCVQGVEDHRGTGWAYVHLCENTFQRLCLSQRDHEEYSALLSELESYANRAVAELKHVDDHLAQGLAYKQLGIALYRAFAKKREGGEIKLERAVAVLQQSIDKLRATGYYRGTGEAFYWLGICQFALWEETSKVEYLTEAIKSFLQGIVSTATRLEARERLKQIYCLLEAEIRKVL
jgi:hypothetical protein